MEFKTILYIIGFILYLAYQYRQATKGKEAKRNARQSRPQSAPQSEKSGDEKDWEKWLEDMLPEEWKEEIEKERRRVAEEENPKTIEVEEAEYMRPVYQSLPATPSPYDQYSGTFAAKKLEEQKHETSTSHSIMHNQEHHEEENKKVQGRPRIKLTPDNAREAVILSEILKRPEY